MISCDGLNYQDAFAFADGAHTASVTITTVAST